MTKCNLLTYKIPKIFVYFLVLVSMEWIFFILYMSIDSTTFPQKNELDFSHISVGTNTTKTRNRTITLQATVKEEKHLKDNTKQRKIVQAAVKKGKRFQDIRTTTVNHTIVQNCTKKVVKFSQTPLPVTGLVGFPGTGSTWLRHLIQQMTGIGTSSMYCDGGLKKKGFPFECTDNIKKGIILIKTHEEKHFKLFKKIVLLIRNPYDAFLAYFSWAKGGHTGHPSKRVLLEANHKMFNWSLWWYVDLTNGTLTRFKGSVHLVQYERLKTDTAYELRKLATFLQVNVTEDDIDCAVKLQEGNFHRNTKDTERLELLRTLFDKGKLLQLRNATDTMAKLIKHRLNLNVDVGGTVEKLLLDKT